MMNKIFILLACLIGICLAEEGIKHPWYMEFRGNNVFSNFQVEEQIDIPDEFGQLDTTKQDFLMRLSIENLKALYYSRGYFSLEMNLTSAGNIFRKTAYSAATSSSSTKANATALVGQRSSPPIQSPSR